MTFNYGGYGGGYANSYGVLEVISGSRVGIDHSTFQYDQGSGVYTTGGGTANISYSTLSNDGSGASSVDGVVNVAHSTLDSNSCDGARVQLTTTMTPGSAFTADTITANGCFGFDVAIPCSNPLSTFPHGELNNIYANSPGNEIGAQLNESNSCVGLQVDWRNNYWGSDVFFMYNGTDGDGEAPGKGSTCSFSPIGYLGYSDATDSLTHLPSPPNKNNGGALSCPDVEGGTAYFANAADAFWVGPGDIQTSPIVNGIPGPTATDLYGDASTSRDGGLEATRNFMKPSCAEPVACSTGNYYETYTDFAIPGLNGGLDFTRTYNSQAASSASPPGPLGHGWSFRFGDSLSVDPNSGNAIVTGAQENTVRFYNNGTGGLWAPPWVQATLVQNPDGTYTYTLPDHRSETFNPAGELTSEQDANGNVTALTYTGPQLTTVTDPSGRSLSFAYNGSGQISEITDPAGRTVQYGYDGSGNLASVKDVGGNTTTYAYDLTHELTQVTSPRGGQITNAYDGSHRLVSQTDPDGGVTTFAYGSNETTITSPTGVVTDERFQNLLPVTITKGYGSAGASSTTITYDGNLNPSTVTDASNHTWIYGYDAQNNLTTLTDPLNHTTTSTYDSSRNVTATQLPSGLLTTYGYDTHDNLTSITRTFTGQQQVTAMSYYTNGLLKTTTDPLLHQTSYGYDQYGDLTSTTTPLGNKSTATFDTVGGVKSVTTARGNVSGCECAAAYTTTFTLDSFERPLQITDPAGKVTTLTYDADGNVTDLYDRDGRHTHTDFTLGDRPYQVTRGDGSVLKTAYWPDGSLKSQTDGLGQVTKFGLSMDDRR